MSAGKEPVRKHHHFRPVHHLRHFANADGTIWAYNRTRPADPVLTGVQAVAGEKYLYAPLDGETPKDDSVERWLADHIDGPAARAIEMLANGGEVGALSRAERSRLAAYIAVQDMRTPKVKDFLVPLFQGELDEEWKEMTLDRKEVQRQIKETQGVEYTEEELEELITSYSVQVNKGVWLDFIQRNVNIAGKRIYGMHWRMVRAPENYAFISNDVGIVKFVNSFDMPRTYVLGFAAGRSHWLFPLSSRWALALDPSEGGEPVEARPAWIKSVNLQMVEDAHRFVYSQRPSPFVTTRWQR